METEYFKDDFKEINKLLECLLANGYEYIDTQEVDSYSDLAEANFKKELPKQDHKIEVSFKFSKGADYENIIEGEDENEYNIDLYEFIPNLIENIKSGDNKSGGKKSKSKSKKSKSKSKKSKSKSKKIYF
jgi:predicted aldo/keto reductase-like oxidoreductase